MTTSNTIASTLDALRLRFITSPLSILQRFPRVLTLSLLLNLPTPSVVCAGAATPNFIPSVKSLTMGSGDTVLTSSSKIYFAHATLKNVADTLKNDIHITQGLDLTVVSGSDAGKGDILLKLNPEIAGAEAYKMTVDGKITLEMQDKKGAWPGTATLLQAIRNDGAMRVANMIVTDKPDKSIRGYQIEVKQGWSMQDIKDEIRLMRLLKLNTLTLHMSGDQSVAMCMDTVRGTSQYQLFTKAEMTEIILYAKNHGVDMIPNCGLQWQFPDTQSAVQNYINDIDGLGAFPNYDDKRFHNFVKEIIKRAIDLHKQGYDDNNVKGIHLGPVNGEGGMSSAEALLQIGYVKDACLATKSWIFGGMNPTDTTLNKYKGEIVQVPYSNVHDPGMRPYVDNGWNCVNITWRPLYMLSGTVSYSQEKVFSDFNHHYFSGEVGNPDYIDTAAAGTLVQGSMLSSWDWPTAYYYDPFLIVGPAYAEHAWNLKPWPYPDQDWKDFNTKYEASYELLSTMQRFSSGPPPPPMPKPGGSTLVSENFSNTSLKGWTPTNSTHSSWTNEGGFCKGAIGNNNANENTELIKDNVTIPDDFTLDIDMKQVSAANPSSPPAFGVTVAGYGLTVCGGQLSFHGQNSAAPSLGKYHHYRIEASGPSLKLYVDYATKPTFDIPRAKNPSDGLKLGMSSFGGSVAFDKIVLVASGIAQATAKPQAGPNLIPWPKSISGGDRMLECTQDTRIIATDPSLLPLAKVLADEWFVTFGVRYAVAQGEAKNGDIVLKLDPSLKGESYTLLVDQIAVVSGGNYAAVALGTVTLSQAIDQRGGKVFLPTLKIEDAPDYRMRAIQMCIKHQVHAISKIKQGVDLCRQYKLNTLALHASNYQMMWMMCPAFRENPLPKGGADGGQTYSLEEMKDLVEYARQRGVAILPEWGPADFAMPGEMMAWFYKARQFGDYKSFDPAKETLLDNPKFWEAIDDLSRQMADIFSTSAYIHVGALDGETGHWETKPDQEFMKTHNLRSSGDVWAWLLKRLYEINKKRGKETMAFEGVSRDAAAHVKLPKEVAFFAYQTWYYPSDAMLADGYRVLNAAWRPLYTVGGYPAREIYAWSPNIVRHNIDGNIDIHLPKSELFLGPLLSTWEGGEIGHMEILTDRGAAMAERCWNEGAGKTWDDFSRRLKPTMARLEAIQYPMEIAVEGLCDNAFLPVDGRWYHGTACYGGPLTITMKPRIPDVKIYYTMQDPYFIWNPDRPGPSNKNSKLYEGPITDAGGIFRAQCFDASGKPVGGEYVKIFQHCPILINVDGADEKFDAKGRTKGRPFHLKAVVKFSTSGDKKLRYRTTPPGTTPDLEYTGPITINKTTQFWVGIVGSEGYQLQTTVGDDGFKQNLLTNDRVKITTDAKNQIGDPNFVCDGYADSPDKHWNGIGEASLTIETAVPRKINELQVFCWWADGRAYRYTIEGSEDGKTWKPLVDWSKNAQPSGPEGYTHKFELQGVRFLRIHTLGNTVNDHGHLTEISAYDTTANAK